MSNTEQFDAWVREEMDSLDSLPDNFRSEVVWQQLQAELHPMAEKKSGFARFFRSKSVYYRVAAAAVLLLLVGSFGWKMQWFVFQPIDKQLVVEKVELVKKPLLATKNEKNLELKEKTLTQPVVRKYLPQKTSKITTIVQASSTSEAVQNTEQVQEAVSSPNEVSPAAKVEISQAPVEMAEAQVISQSPRNQTSKNRTKPAFKIIHANELADYHKVEMAEAREKEAKAKGFVVINWQTNSGNQSESSIMTYLRKKD
ncbi:MAG: hypothetical protein LCH91_15740 [Bacteroidetes bacterium]|nr:hypothetical protein [Bacteroidota bacterium]